MKNSGAWLAGLILGAWLNTSDTAVAAPVLVSVSPTLESTNVASSSELRFVFSEPMQPRQALALTNSLEPDRPHSGGFSAWWTDGGTTLRIRPNVGFIRGTEIDWALTAEGFRSVAGDSLERDYAGRFRVAQPAVPGAFFTYGVSRQNSHLQTNQTDQPALLPGGAVFGVSLQGGGGTAHSGAFTAPGSTPVSLQAGWEGGGLFLFLDSFDDPAVRDQAYPGGLYSLRLTTRLGHSTNVATVAGTPLPAAPRILNFDETQAVDPSDPFLLRLDAGGLATDKVSVALTLPGEIVGAFIASNLTGESNHCVVPANVLLPDMLYQVEIRRIVAFPVSLQGSIVSSVLEQSVTHGFLRTVSPRPAIQVRSLRRLANAAGIELLATVKSTNHFFVLERSEDLVFWMPANSSLFRSQERVFRDRERGQTVQFYRIRQDMEANPLTVERFIDLENMGGGGGGSGGGGGGEDGTIPVFPPGTGRDD